MPAIEWIGAAAQLSNTLNQGFQSQQNRMDQDINRQRDLQDWNRVNEYNSPKSQMQRFADAGLNPHLIYGQGNSGSAGSIPQREIKNIAPDINFGNAVNTYLELKSKDKSIELQDKLLALKEGEINRQNVDSTYNAWMKGSPLDGMANEQARNSPMGRILTNAGTTSQQDINKAILDIATKRINNQILAQRKTLGDYEVKQADYDDMLWRIYGITKEDGDSVRLTKIIMHETGADKAVRSIFPNLINIRK